MRIPLFPPPPKEGVMVLRNPFETGIIAFLDTLARSSTLRRRVVQYPVARLTRLASEYPSVSPLDFIAPTDDEICNSER